MVHKQKKFLTVFLIFILFTASIIADRFSLHYDPFSTSEPFSRSWYLELTIPEAPTSVQSNFLTSQLETEIARYQNVQKVYGVSFRKKIVIAFLTDTKVDSRVLESDVRFAANKALTSMGDQGTVRSNVLLFSKPVHVPFRGIATIGKAHNLGITDELVFQNEFDQLFGDPGKYNERAGFLPLITGDLVVTLSDNQSATISKRLMNLVTERLSKELESMKSLQLTVARDIPQRVIDLEYNGLDLLPQGLDGSQIANQLAKKPEEHIARSVLKTSREFPGAAKTEDDTEQILRTPILPAVPTLEQKNPLNTLTLQDIVKAKPHYQMMSALLSRGSLSNVFLQPIDRSLLLKPPKNPGRRLSGQTLKLDFLITNPLEARTISATLNDVLDKMRLENPFLNFTIQNNSVHNSSHEFRLNLLYAFLLFALSATFLSHRLPGSRFLSSFGLSGFVFASLSIFTGIELSSERLATALGLFFVYAFSSELPLAKDHALKTMKTIKSERVHVMLLLMTLPVLFAIYVLDFDFSFSERQHLLAFSLASLSIFLASTFCQRRIFHSFKTYDDEEETTRHLIIGSLCLIPMLVPLFEKYILSTHPPAVAFFGSLELTGSPEKIVSQANGFSSRIENLRQRGVHSLFYGGPTTEQVSIFEGTSDQQNSLSPEIVSSLLSGTNPILEHFVKSQQTPLHRQKSEPHDQKELTESMLHLSDAAPIYLRVLDRDLSTEHTASGIHSLRYWLMQARLPDRPLLDLLKPTIGEEQTKMITRKGKPILVFSGYGKLIGPSNTAQESTSIAQSLARLVEDLDLSKNALELTTNTSEHDKNAEKSLKLSWIISLLILSSGALFFGSLKGAIQTYFTYLLSYGIAKPILTFVYTFSGYLYVVSDLELQIASIATSLALLSIWARICADTNESRKANLTLDRALAPFFHESRRLYRIVLSVACVSLVLSLSFYTFRFISGAFLSSFVALLVFPSWVYLWTVLEESFNRTSLRTMIWIRTIHLDFTKISRIFTILLTFLCVNFFEGFFTSAQAQEVTNTSCTDSGFAVLPFMNKPQSVESSLAHVQVTEIMTSQLPCGKTISDFTGRMKDILEQNRGPENYINTVDQAKQLLRELRIKIQEIYAADIEKSRSEAYRFGIVTGFVEELYGFTGLTVIHDFGDSNERYLKFTVRSADLVPLIKKIAQYFDKNDKNILTQLEEQNDLIPVSLEKIDSLHSADQSKTKVLRFEVQNFLRSRFENPLPPEFLERKQFFRLSQKNEKPKYDLRITLETLGPRIFASVRARDGTNERSVWVEDDITNLQNFESNLLKGSRQALASLEGIFDYSLVLGPAFFASNSRLSTLISGIIRQNRGVLAFSGRFRAGKGNTFKDTPRTQTLLLLGAATGYQFLDFRWLSVDLGFAADGGIAQADSETESPDANPEPNILILAGPYAQTFISLSSGLSFAVRVGLEKPYELGTGDHSQAQGLLPFKLDSFLGVGYSF